MMFNRKINLLTRRFFSVCLISLIAPWLSPGAWAENMQFSGELVSTACNIIPPEDIQLQNAVSKYLYNNTRTQGQTFTIKLIDCDLAISDRVEITFSGDGNPALPGLLSVTGIKGIGVGLEGVDDKPIKLDKDTLTTMLNKGSNDLTFKVYVQGEPEAIKNKTIEPGQFSAITTFNLVYP